MALVMPYDQLSQIVSSSQLTNANEIPIFLKAINHACLILGIIILFAIVPSLLRSPRENTTEKTLKS
jgi:hypothetical protein